MLDGSRYGNTHLEFGECNQHSSSQELNTVASASEFVTKISPPRPSVHSGEREAGLCKARQLSESVCIGRSGPATFGVGAVLGGQGFSQPMVVPELAGAEPDIRRLNELMHLRAARQWFLVGERGTRG